MRSYLRTFGVLAAAFACLATLLAGLPAPRAAASKDGLLWPLPMREGCTSSFGEYRRTHFHGGVDMRTSQSIGWPCYAVADGAVVRIRREAGGYGRVLYLQLDDGRTAVYGHLCRYESKKLGLEDALLRACEKAGKSFPGTITLDPPRRVKAGDIVAYSGDLGVGSPHLHFEVRRGERLCDPFREGLPLPAGVTPPVIRGVRFVPLEANASVNGSLQPVLVRAVVLGNHRYKLDRGVSISGRVDVEAVVTDHLGIPGNNTGITELRGFADKRPFFDMDLTCISLERYKESPNLFDPGGDLPGSTAYRLRKLPAMHVHGIRGTGFPSGLGEGPHELKIVAANSAGQPCELTGTVRVAPDPVDSRLSLPGAGYALHSLEILPAGILLELTRTGEKGVTPVTVGGEPMLHLRVRMLGGGKINVLLPVADLPRTGGALVLGKDRTPWLLASGPGDVADGGFHLSVPAGASAAVKAVPAGSFESGSAYYCELGPYERTFDADVTFPGFTPRPKLGVYLRERHAFLDNWTGKPVPFFRDGTYGLVKDVTSPYWGHPRIVTIPHLSIPELRIRLRDHGSGPDLRTLRLALDGRTAFADWDPDTGQVRIDLSGLKAGRHTLSGTCSDFAGNEARLPARTFTLHRQEGRR